MQELYYKPNGYVGLPTYFCKCSLFVLGYPLVYTAQENSGLLFTVS